MPGPTGFILSRALDLELGRLMDHADCGPGTLLCSGNTTRRCSYPWEVSHSFLHQLSSLQKKFTEELCKGLILPAENKRT
jgi:hypothetical protein